MASNLTKRVAEVECENAARDSQGRFAKGNAGGPGNPFAKKASQLRAAFMDCATVEDMRALFDVVMRKALDGDLAAINLILDRCVGKPRQVGEDEDEPDGRVALQYWNLIQVTRAMLPREVIDLDDHC